MAAIVVEITETVNNVVQEITEYPVTVSDVLKIGEPSSGLTYYQSAPPVSPTSTGTKGYYSIDDDYLYTCYETNKWKRVPILKDTW